MSDDAPGRIIGRFGQLRLGQLRTGHIAHDDALGASGDGGRDLVRPVFALILDLGVNGLNALFLARALRQGQLVFVLTGEVLAAIGVAHVGAGDLVFDTQIDANLCLPHRLCCVFNLALQVDVPASTGVLGEAAFFDHALDVSGTPQAKQATGVPDGIADEFDAVHFERYPAQMPLAAAPGKTTLAELLTLLDILRANALDGVGMKAEFRRTASRELVQVVGREPLAISTQGQHRDFVTIVPHIVHRIRQAYEVFSMRTIFHAVLIGNH